MLFAIFSIWNPWKKNTADFGILKGYRKQDQDSLWITGTAVIATQFCYLQASLVSHMRISFRPSNIIVWIQSIPFRSIYERRKAVLPLPWNNSSMICYGWTCSLCPMRLYMLCSTFLHAFVIFENMKGGTGMPCMPGGGTFQPFTCYGNCRFEGTLPLCTNTHCFIH